MSLHARFLTSFLSRPSRWPAPRSPRGIPMHMRDELGPPTRTRHLPRCSHWATLAEAPAQLALITVMQFAEGLSDAQAADAVRARIDWKYALAPDLTDPGFDASVLSEFRQRLITGHAELLLFETMLPRFQEQGLLKAKGRQRTDSTHVLAAIQTLNRLECIGETLRHALNVLATVAPNWLRSCTRGVVRSLPPAVCRLSLAARKACPLHSCRANRD